MKFTGLNVEDMFADAVNASENTGEDNPENYGKNTTKGNEIILKAEEKTKVKEETPKINSKSTKENKSQNVDKDNVKDETQITIDKKERLGPLIKSDNNRLNENVDIKSIERIIEMKDILDNYNTTELKFVKGYFQHEKGTHAEIIYKALTANYRGLSALNKIVAARGHTSADRAFYLMELDNNSIGDIYEQVDLLTGELGEPGKVSEINKIKVCRVLEKSIAEMADDVFTYINRLQEFTNKAISE
ncbi:MAG TPA: hypothetical protein GXZ90_08555 [Clostridiales bacterium]|nr:hypothetical protein [Clostridiales bacterium]